MSKDSTGHRTQNSLLTASHRQFLRDQENYFDGDHAAQMRSEKRREIVDRVRHGLRDFELLFRYLRQTDLEAVFETDSEESLDAERTVSYAIAIMFFGFGDEATFRTDAQGPAVNVDGGPVRPGFENALESGLRRALRRQGYRLKSARLDINAEGPIDDLEEIIEKMADGTASREEILHLLENVELPLGSIQKAILEDLKDHTDMDHPAE